MELDVTMSSTPQGVRGRLGRALQRVYPDLDRAAYERARWREVRARSAAGTYAELEARHPILTQPDATVTRPAHVVVVPHEGEDYGQWAPGLGNFYYEVTENLRDRIGADRVSVFHTRRGEPSASWQARLADLLADTKATHLITHIEQDPGSDAQSWTWDSFWDAMHRRWDGVLIGVMFDSSYRFISAKSRMLARMSPRFVVGDICLPMDGSMVRGRPEAGPLNRPMSEATLALIDERLQGIEPQYDVSFIGVLYPYRVELLDRLRESGLSVAVNPHRGDVTVDAEASRRNQPTWLDYLAGLRSSHMTINFSQSSAGPFQQLKWRVIEAGLAGTYLLTDDRERTSQFWTVGDFGSFTGPDDLPGVVRSVLARPDDLARAADAFHDRAVELSRTQFWDTIDSTLRRRALPGVGLEDVRSSGLQS